MAQPTDIIVGKLQAWTEGHSNKHPADILQMLAYDFSGFSTQHVNLEHVSREAARLGKAILILWQELVARAQREVENENGD